MAYFKVRFRNLTAKSGFGNSFSTTRDQTPKKELRIRYTPRKVKDEGIRIQAFRAAVAQIPALCATTRQGIMIPLLRRFGEKCYLNFR